MGGLRLLWLLPLLALPYLRVLRAPFVYDDKMEVVGNRTLRFLGELDQIASYNLARPLLILSYALNWAAGGLDPLGYHLVGLGLHLLNSVLAWSLATRLLPPGRALLATALWALHPMCIEAVTYTTGRSDALVATWVLLGCIGWLDLVRGAAPARARRGAVLAAVAFLLGLASKEVAIVLPLLWLGLERGQTGRIAWGRQLPGLGLMVLAVGARVAWLGWPAPEVPRSAAVHLLGQAEVWVVYLRLWLLPYGQSILHDYAVGLRWQGGAALLGLGAMAAVAARRGGVVAFGALLWAAVLTVSSAFVLKETMAEHRSYLAGFGLLLALVGLLPREGRPGERALWLLPPLLGLATALRNEDWRSEERLWASATDVNPASAEAWYGYGDALRFAGRQAEAEAAFRESLRLADDRPDSWVNLGITRAEQGDLPGAEAAWREALKRKPGHCAALNNLAAAAARRGRRTEAVSGYLGTLRFCPDDPVALENLGALYWELGDLGRAATWYQRWLDQGPGGPGARVARERVDLATAAGSGPRR